MTWIKVASDLDWNPKIRRAGNLGRQVFEFALRRHGIRYAVTLRRNAPKHAQNAEGSAEIGGYLPSDDLDPTFVADTLMLDVAEAEAGLAKAIKARLISPVDGGYQIVGFDEEWDHIDRTNAERQAKYRERKKEQSNARNALRNNAQITMLQSNASDQIRSEEIRSEREMSEVGTSVSVPLDPVDQLVESEAAQEAREALTATQTQEREQAAPPPKRMQPKPRQSVGAIAASAPAELTRPEIEPPPEALTLAQLLLDYVCKNHPQTRLATSPDRVKELTVLRWGNAIRKLHAIDRVEYVQIAGMIHWCQRHSWWKAAILSAETLRAKFDTMQAQRKRPKPGDPAAPDPAVEADRVARAAREKAAYEAEIATRAAKADEDREEVAEGLTELKQKLGIVP